MKPIFITRIILTIFLLYTGLQGASIIDHTCADLDQVPAYWIEFIQDNIPSHYAHTSHGGQLTYGLQFIESDSSFYDCTVGISYLPTTAGAWCIFDGQESDSYITPDLYWETAAGMNLTRNVLDNNPDIETSMWCWCTQMDYYSESQVQAYLDSMTVLESEYPDITFIYFTGNAQGTGSDGYNRWQRNEQVRDYCNANDKYLFDFADLDCWWYNPSSSSWEQHTYSYSTYTIPAEHPQFYGDDYAHTTAESCYQKGEALWYMMALIAGWQGTSISDDHSAGDDGLELSVANPCYGTARVFCTAPQGHEVSVQIYSLDGRLLDTPFTGETASGGQEIYIEGLHPGLYLLVVRSNGTASSERLILLN
jgi:hypothetical protein